LDIVARKKLIVSAVWFAATFLAVVLAALRVSFNVGSMTAFFRGIGELLEQLTAYYALNGAAMAVEFVALCFFGCCAMCLHFYAALAVGHSFPTHKMAWSVLWFFVFSFATQFLFGAAMVVLDETGLAEWMFRTVDAWVLTPMAQMHLAFGMMIVLCIAYGAIFYGVTVAFLKRRLNLE